MHCLEGRVTLTAYGKVQTLEAGHLLYLSTGEPHSVKGIENASLLVTEFCPSSDIAAPWPGLHGRDSFTGSKGELHAWASGSNWIGTRGP